MTEFRKVSRVFVPFEQRLSGTDRLMIVEELPKEFEIKEGEYVELIVRKADRG